MRRRWRDWACSPERAFISIAVSSGTSAMPRLLRLEDIERLYAERGGLNYGEDVTQLEHAVQCASLAEAEDHPPSLIVAALLHDIGHLLEEEKAVTESVIDRRHEMVGARALSFLFGDDICAP